MANFEDDFIIPLGGRSRSVDVIAPPWIRGPGSHTWTCPADGIYKFQARGPGGAGFLDTDGSAGDARGGGAGGRSVRNVRCAKGQTVSVVVTKGMRANRGQATDAPAATTITLPGGIVLTANCGAIGTSSTNGAGGTATGGEINETGGAGNADGPSGTYAGLKGTASGTNTGGGGAPGDEILRGGDGGDANNGAINASQVGSGAWPGGGGGSGTSSAEYRITGGAGGDGAAVITYESA